MSKRATFIWIALCSLLIYAGGMYMFTKYSVLSKAAIEEIVTDTLGVKVTIGELHLNLEQGTARLGHVRIFNPRFFSDGAALEIENIDILIDTWSRGMIKFRDIQATGAQVNLEVQRKRQNLASIMDKMNVKDSASEPLTGEKLKIMIDALSMKDNRVRPRYVLTKRAAKTVAAPDIEMRAIGYAENGLPTRQALQQIWTQIIPGFERTAAQAGFFAGMNAGPADREDDESSRSHHENERMISE